MPIGSRVGQGADNVSKNLYSVYTSPCLICHNKAYEVKLWDIALT